MNENEKKDLEWLFGKLLSAFDSDWVVVGVWACGFNKYNDFVKKMNKIAKRNNIEFNLKDWYHEGGLKFND